MLEDKRLLFLINRDDIQGALEFAKQTIPLYRKMVVFKIGIAGNKFKRREFTQSILEFKKFIKDMELLGENHDK